MSETELPKRLRWRESSAEWPPPSPQEFPSSDAEILIPHHECPSRKAGLLPATFNLVATIVGGGILSVPLAFQKCGIVLATVLMVTAAVLTDFSLYILCSCARRTGAKSYGEVCRLSYGAGLEVFITLLLFIFLLFVIVAFMVLVRDIWTPVATLALNTAKGQENQSVDPTNNESLGDNEANGNTVLLVIVVMMAPFLLRKDLHALRYNCYVGFVSITVLCVAITHRAWEKFHGGDGAANEEPITVFPDSFADVLFAFPIIMLSFLSQFNIISIHGSLINPTRKRIRLVIDVAVGLCFVLTYVFGLMGYLFAGEGTRGNILLNFHFGDKLVLAGRLGCGVTIMLAMPMVTLPCRESVLALGPQFEAWKRNTSNKGGRSIDQIVEGENEEEDTPDESFGDEEMVPLHSSRSRSLWHREADPEAAPVSADNKSAQNDTEGTPLLHSNGTQKEYQTPDRPVISEPGGGGQEDGVQLKDSGRSEGRLVHFGSTFIIISTCYVGAVTAPGVAVVWSICGSSMAFLIAFILPAVCYIKVRAKRKGHWNKRILTSWFMLAVSVAGAVACTLQTVWRMFFLGYGE